MALAKSHAASTRELKHRTLTCLNKLSDRDTYSAAAEELESIAKTLSPDTIPSFLSSISATDASEKSPVRKQCVRLISLLSESHGDALSPYLSKLLNTVIRRLRDNDSAIRSACVEAIRSISSHVTRPPFTSIAKPLLEALATEQELNSQIGAALCLAAAIDASPDPDPLYLKKLLPRIEKLLKSDSFRAKPALLTLVGSVIGAGAASGHQTASNLVPCLIDYIGSDDWAARKAAAEALVKLAVAERDVLVEFKSACLKTIEARKCDKVKIVRETMNQLVEAWKEIPDVSDESFPQESQTNSKEDASDGRYPPGSKQPEMKKNSFPSNRTSPRDGSIATTARKQSPLESSDKKPGPALFRKLDRKKPAKVETTTPSSRGGYEDDKGKTTLTRPEAKRSLFCKDVDNKMLKGGGLRTGSRVFPCRDESSGSTLVVSKTKEKENDELSLIRKQLVHIENQQSNLLDILQNFIGRSENGMHSLETRVQGLERALDAISYDLTMSTGRKSNNIETTCLNLPGADFFSPKFWRRTQPRNSTSWFSSPRVAPPAAATAPYCRAESFKPENKRMQRGGGFIVNPLAEIHHGSHGITESSANGGLRNAQGAI